MTFGRTDKTFGRTKQDKTEVRHTLHLRFSIQKTIHYTRKTIHYILYTTIHVKLYKNYTNYTQNYTQKPTRQLYTEPCTATLRGQPVGKQDYPAWRAVLSVTGGIAPGQRQPPQCQPGGLYAREDGGAQSYLGAHLSEIRGRERKTMGRLRKTRGRLGKTRGRLGKI